MTAAQKIAVFFHVVYIYDNFYWVSKPINTSAIFFYQVYIRGDSLIYSIDSSAMFPFCISFCNTIRIKEMFLSVCIPFAT